ncbi:MAG: 23S rRNA (adenine(2503)-C(2))-methyltransferase RlmN [Kiloniellales bacterium]
MSQLSHAQRFAPPPGESGGPRPLIGLTREELGAELQALGEPAFRARQLWHWMYHRGATEFEAMTSLSKAFRARLGEHFTVDRPVAATAQESRDGTRKWLVRFTDGQEVEAVHIPEDGRGTLCVSSQVGCTLTCRFCYTGTQRLVRNLGAAEIVGQVMLAHDALGEWPRPHDGRRISNLVLMGMGEPLYNYDNVARALKVIMDPEGLAFSKRKITLSTSGVVPMMARCGTELGVNLAVSLHAVTDELRDRLMPINKKYPLAELMKACRAYPGAHNARRITFEYVLLKGVNDSESDARELARLLKGLPAKVNLIPFNPWPGAPFECSEPKVIARFAEILMAAHLAAPIREPRGLDILAACGQLKSASVRARTTRPSNLAPGGAFPDTPRGIFRA